MAEPSHGSEIGLGSVLGGTYQVAGLLGKGGMGAVYAATHLRLPGKKFAIKVLHAGVISAEAYARFRREAEIASRIGHPNIIEVIDWNTLPDGTPYLVLEFLGGESLAKRMERGPLPLDMTLGLVRQIGSALAAAHRAGIVHRDLKPDNIFLCPTDSGGQVSDHVKVLDFGISKIKNSTTVQTQEAQLLGTPQYMAPEQASGKNKEVDQRTDVFALGAIVYEMLSGRPAFAGENLAQVVYQVVFEEPAPLGDLVPGLPPAMLRALERALAKDPGARFPDIQSFVAELTGRPLLSLGHVDAQPALAFEPTVNRDGSLALGATSAAMAAGTGSRAMAAGSIPATPLATAPPPLTGPPPPFTAAAAPPPAKKKSRMGLVLGLVGLAVAGGAAAAVVVTQQGKPPDPAKPPVVNAEKPPEPAKPPVVVNADKPPEPAKPPEPKPPEPAKPVAVVNPDKPPEPAAVVVDAGQPPQPPEPPKPAGVVVHNDKPPEPQKPPEPKHPIVKPPPKPPEPKVPEPKVPEPEEPAAPGPVAGELREADQALRDGSYDEAIRLARRSLTTMRTERAYVIITVAFCGKRDLSNAKANLLNAHGRARFNAIRTCRKLDFPLD
jgi:serine/threonine-protein kinase